jgi:hypothetical protein
VYDSEIVVLGVYIGIGIRIIVGVWVFDHPGRDSWSSSRVSKLRYIQDLFVWLLTISNS